MSTISASTTSTTAYKVTADTTGALVLQTGSGPTTAVTISTGQVVTFAQAPVLPSGSIPQAALATNVAGTGPTFSAYNSTNQSVSNNVSTKATLNTTDINSGNGWDTTNNWFKPSVAGYYQINFQLANDTACYYKIGTLKKNGSNVLSGSRVDAAQSYSSNGSVIVYLNGSTDYIELYGYVSAGSVFSCPASTDLNTRLSGFLVRAA